MITGNKDARLWRGYPLLQREAVPAFWGLDQIINRRSSLSSSTRRIPSRMADQYPIPPALHLDSLLNSLGAGLAKTTVYSPWRRSTAGEKSCMLTSIVSTQWKKPLSLSTQILICRMMVLRLHPVGEANNKTIVHMITLAGRGNTMY